jgi:putative flippase GtrA
MSAVVTMGEPPEPTARPAQPPREGDPPIAPRPGLHDGGDPQAPARGILHYLGRHQIASFISTAVDFGVMTLAVELLHGTAVIGTLAGASCGALANFQLGRHWVYAARHDHVGEQAGRYALISASSAGLNALGEYGLHDVLGVQYLAARAVVAVAVSLLWNFPMQRYFVFRAAKASRGRA